MDPDRLAMDLYEWAARVPDLVALGCSRVGVGAKRDGTMTLRFVLSDGAPIEVTGSQQRAKLDALLGEVRKLAADRIRLKASSAS